jgi:Acetyltransferase (GNAT) domain
MKSMGEQLAYRNWAETQAEFPLFHQPWRLDAICGAAAWDAVLARDAQGRVTAGMPFALKQRWGLSWGDSPPLTPYLGPWLAFPEGQKIPARQKFISETLHELQELLPKDLFFFRQKWRPDAAPAQAFWQAGHQCVINYTFRIDLRKTAEEIWAQFSPELRNNIRQAEKELHINLEGRFDDFFPLQAQSLSRKAVPLQREIFTRLDEAQAQRRVRHIYQASAGGQVLAAIYLVEDTQGLYFLASGRTEEAPSGAVASLLWRALQEYAGKNGYFDFEGSFIPGIEQFFRQFGGSLDPYCVSSRWRYNWAAGLAAWRGIGR